MHSLFLILIFTVLVSFSHAATNEEAAAAENKKKIAQDELAEAKAKQDKALLGIADLDLAGKEGTVETDDKSGYYATVLAYESVDEAAKAIVTIVEGKNTKSNSSVMLLTSAPDYQAVALYGLTEKRINKFKDDIEANKAIVDGKLNSNKAFTSAALAAIPIAAELIGAAAEIASMFKKDVTIKGLDVDVGTLALRTAVAKHLLSKGNKYEVLYPELNAISNQLTPEETTIIKKLYELIAIADELRTNLALLYKNGGSNSYQTAVDSYNAAVQAEKKIDAQIKKEPNNQELLDAKAAAQKVQVAYKPRKIEWEKFSGEINKLLKEFDDYSTTLIETPKGREMAPISVAGLVEATYGDSSINHLYLNVLSSGGEMRVTESKWFSGHISHIGSVTCEFTYVEEHKKIRATDLITKSIYDGDFERVADEGKLEPKTTGYYKSNRLKRRTWSGSSDEGKSDGQCTKCGCCPAKP